MAEQVAVQQADPAGATFEERHVKAGEAARHAAKKHRLAGGVVGGGKMADEYGVPSPIINLNKRTPGLERAHLAIRHPPAGRQRVRPTQLTLSDSLHGEQPTADRVVSAE